MAYTIRSAIEHHKCGPVQFEYLIRLGMFSKYRGHAPAYGMYLLFSLFSFSFDSQN